MSASKIFVSLTLGRRKEYKADKFATKYGYGKYLIPALEKMIKDRPKPSNIITKFLMKIQEKIDMHPSLENRIKAILNDEQLMKSKGKVDKNTIKNVVEKHLKPQPA